MSSAADGAPERAKRSISFAVRDPDDPSRVLAVRRPPDDEELPDAWGLPAGSLRPGEDWQDAVRRAGREKLGLELAVGPLLNEGELTRGDPEGAGYVLRMRLYEASILAGRPQTDQPERGVTRYTAWGWAPAGRFEPAARAGSLCCRLWLDVV